MHTDRNAALAPAFATISAVLALVLWVGRGDAEFVPAAPSAPHDVLTEPLMTALDSAGIDVVSHEHVTTRFAASARPRVALLSGFHGGQPSAAWSREFQRGLVGAVLAVRSDGGAPGAQATGTTAFLAQWTAAPTTPRSRCS